MRALGEYRDAVLIAAVVGVLLVLTPARPGASRDSLHKVEPPALATVPKGGIELCAAQAPTVDSQAEPDSSVDVLEVHAWGTEPLTAILIEGNRRHTTEEILKLIETSVGQCAHAKLVKEDIRTLLKVRWFSSVEARAARSAAGPILVFRVVERPILENVSFIGNGKFDDAALLNVSRLRPRHLYDVGTNKESARRIENFYREAGYLYVTVVLEKGSSPDDREVVFNINEGPKVVVSGTSFDGNQTVPDWILRLQLKCTTPMWLLSDGLYDPATVPDDIIGLKQYYQELGYFDVQVTDREWVSADRSRVHIQFAITEGQRYWIRNIEFAGNAVISAETLRQETTLRENDYFDQSVVNADQQRIRDQYRALGRIFASVEPRYKALEEPDIVDLVYTINEDVPLRNYKPPIRGNAPLLPYESRAAAIIATIFGNRPENGWIEPDGLREIEHIQFRGIDSFDIADVRKQFSEDFNLLCAAHPDADLLQYLDSLEAALRSGYRHGGFPAAEVEVVYNNSRKRIEAGVTEGKRYRCGNVEIRGARQVSAETVTGWLTEDPKPYRVLWKKGAPTPFDDDNFRICDRLKSEYGYAGLFYPEFDVAINGDEKTGIATLVVTVHDEGPRAVVGKIIVTGTKRDSVDEVLQYLDLHPGVPFDNGLCHRLERRLLESGRYLAADVEVEYLFPSENGEIEGQPLAIRLHEYKDAPPLGKEFTPAEHALLKLRDWLDRWAQGDVEDDVVATLDLSPKAVAEVLSSLGDMLPEGWQPEKTRDMQATLRLVLGPNRGETMALRVLGASGELFLDIVFVAGSDRLILADLARQAKLVLPNSTKPRLVFDMDGRSASMEELDRGASRFSIYLGMGLSNKSRSCPTPFEVRPNFSTTCMISFAHDKNSKSALADGILKIEDEASRMEIDAASGRLVNWRSQDEEDGWKLTIRAEKDALKHEMHRLQVPLAASAVAYDGASPWKSVLEFLVDEGQYAARQAGSRDLAASLKALCKLVHHWSPPGFDELWGPYDDADEPHERFQIPSQSQGFSFDGLWKPGPSRRKLVGLFLPMYRRLVPKTGCWWPAGRDAALNWAAGNADDLYFLQRDFLEYLGRRLGEVIDRCDAHAGKELLSARGFGALCQPFLSDDSWLGKWCVSLAQSAARLDEKEVQALGRLLPEPELQKTLADCLKLLRSDADQPIAERLQTAFSGLWFDLVRPYVEANFGDPCRPSDNRPLTPIPDSHVLPAAAEEEATEGEQWDSPPPIEVPDDGKPPSVWTPKAREPARLTPPR